jgi:hypothetical protein
MLVVAVDDLKPPRDQLGSSQVISPASTNDKQLHQVHHVSHTLGSPPLDTQHGHPCSRRLAPLRLPADLLSRLISLQPPFNIRRINTRPPCRVFQHLVLRDILRPAMIRSHHSLNQRPLHLSPVLPADQTYQPMSIPRRMSRSQLAGPVEDDPRRAACGVHALRQCRALLGGAVCQDDIGKGELVDGVGMRVVVEVVGSPTDFEDVELAAGVGLSVEGNGSVKIALVDEAPLGVSVGLYRLERGTHSANKVEYDLDLDDHHGRSGFAMLKRRRRIEAETRRT